MSLPMWGQPTNINIPDFLKGIWDKASSILVNAQPNTYTLTVQVNDTNGSPINSATVSVAGQTKSGAQVTFNLAQGTYSVTASAPNYEPLTVTVKVPDTKVQIFQLRSSSQVPTTVEKYRKDGTRIFYGVGQDGLNAFNYSENIRNQWNSLVDQLINALQGEPPSKVSSYIANKQGGTYIFYDYLTQKLDDYISYSTAQNYASTFIPKIKATISDVNSVMPLIKGDEEWNNLAPKVVALYDNVMSLSSNVKSLYESLFNWYNVMNSSEKAIMDDARNHTLYNSGYLAGITKYIANNVRGKTKTFGDGYNDLSNLKSTYSTLQNEASYLQNLISKLQALQQKYHYPAPSSSNVSNNITNAMNNKTTNVTQNTSQQSQSLLNNALNIYKSANLNPISTSATPQTTPTQTAATIVSIPQQPSAQQPTKTEGFKITPDIAIGGLVALVGLGLALFGGKK